MTIRIKFLRYSHLNDDITNIPQNCTGQPVRYIIIPDDLNIEGSIQFKFSRYDDRCHNTVMSLSVVIDSDEPINDFIVNEIGIYHTHQLISPIIPFMKIITVNDSKSPYEEIFNSDISYHKLCMSHDGDSIVVDGNIHSISTVIFDNIKMDNVNLLKELKKLNVLTVYS